MKDKRNLFRVILVISERNFLTNQSKLQFIFNQSSSTGKTSQKMRALKLTELMRAILKIKKSLRKLGEKAFESIKREEKNKRDKGICKGKKEIIRA